MSELSNEILELAKKYNVNVDRDIWNDLKNTSWSAGNDIYIGEYEDYNIELVSFFHELGHIKMPEFFSNKRVCLAKMTQESLAWEIGLNLAFENGYIFDGYVLEWARKQLKTYNRDENFL